MFKPLVPFYLFDCCDVTVSNYSRSPEGQCKLQPRACYTPEWLPKTIHAVKKGKRRKKRKKIEGTRQQTTAIHRNQPACHTASLLSGGRFAIHVGDRVRRAGLYIAGRVFAARGGCSCSIVLEGVVFVDERVKEPNENRHSMARGCIRLVLPSSPMRNRDKCFGFLLTVALAMSRSSRNHLLESPALPAVNE